MMRVLARTLSIKEQAEDEEEEGVEDVGVEGVLEGETMVSEEIG